VIFTDSNPPSVTLYDGSTGSSTVLTSSGTLVTPAGVTVAADRDVIFTDWLGLSMYRVDLLGNLTTVATGLLNNPNRVIEDYNGDIVFAGYALGYAPSSLMRIDATAAVTTVAVLAGNPFDVKLERASGLPLGDYLVTLAALGELIRVDGAGNITTIATGLAFPTGVEVFPNGDYAVVLAGTDEIVRIPRGGGTPTVWVPSSMLGNVKDIVATGDGGFLVAEAGGPLGSRVMQIDPAGNVSQVLGNSNFGLLQSVTQAATLVAPLNPGTGLNGLFGLSISFPSLPNAQYTTFCSGQLYPGISFPGDIRSTPLNPDPLFLQSFAGGFPGVTTGWASNLDGSGAGVITMDLTPFPAGAFAGSRVHLQVAVIDFTAPLNIGAMSNVATLRFQ